IVLDERGRFWNGPFLIDHTAMTRAFASWIRRHPDDGRFILTNGYDWTYFTVRGAPFFVRGVRGEPHGEIALELFDGTAECLDRSGLSVTPEGVLHARVKSGGFDAQFLPAAQSQMTSFIDEGSTGEPCILFAGERFPIHEHRAC